MTSLALFSGAPKSAAIEEACESWMGESLRRVKMESKEFSEYESGTTWEMLTGRCWAKKVEIATSVRC